MSEYIVFATAVIQNHQFTSVVGNDDTSTAFHNIDSSAHENLRSAIYGQVANMIDMDVYEHDTNSSAHEDIRNSVGNAVSTCINKLYEHDTDTSAHEDIRQALPQTESGSATYSYSALRSTSVEDFGYLNDVADVKLEWYRYGDTVNVSINLSDVRDDPNITLNTSSGSIEFPEGALPYTPKEYSYTFCNIDRINNGGLYGFMARLYTYTTGIELCAYCSKERDSVSLAVNGINFSYKIDL